MSYESGYKNRFGPPRRARKSAPLPEPVAEVATEVLVEVDPELEEPIPSLSSAGVEELAKSLADDYTKTELKAMATEYSIEFKSNILERDLATLIAEYKLTQGV